MHKPVVRHACLAPVRREVKTGRCGTAIITLAELERRLGPPHQRDIVGKIKALWSIDTPRGAAEISDYWWNAKDEISIRGSYRACLWAAAWLRNRLGIRAAARLDYAALSARRAPAGASAVMRVCRFVQWFEGHGSMADA